MPPLALTSAQCRDIDRRAIQELGMPGLVLMENAGRGVVDKLFQFGIPGPVVVCCGRGNNGGDGFVIARHLDNRRQKVRVLLLASPDQLQGDALANYRLLLHSDIPVTVFDQPLLPPEFAAALPARGWIVDALLGTGTSGAPRPPLDAAIRAMNAAKARKLAVDLPSGFNADTGIAANPTFMAEHTCTFVAAKPGFFADGAHRYTGVVHIVDIGVPRRLVDDALQAVPRS